MYNKGQTGEDTIFIVVALFVIVIGFMVISYVYPLISSEMVKNPTVNESSEAVKAINSGNNVISMLDWVVLALYLGFMISFIVLGYFIEAHSVFAVIYIFVMIIGVIISAVMSYVYGFIRATTYFSGLTMPITDHLMSNLPMYYTIVAIVALVVTFAKQ